MTRAYRGAGQPIAARCQGRRPRRSLLQVALDLGDGPRGCRALVAAEFALCPALAQQVPALVERLLSRPQRRVFLLRGQLASGEPGTEGALGLDQVVDPAKYLLVVHS